MSALTNKAQIIEKDGKPIFAVIPYEDYMAMVPLAADKEEDTNPHEMVGLVVKKRNEPGESLADISWIDTERSRPKGRSHPSGHISNGKSENTHRSSTLEKLAAAMGLSVEQLKD